VSGPFAPSRLTGFASACQTSRPDAACPHRHRFAGGTPWRHWPLPSRRLLPDLRLPDLALIW